jgi:hypothetical protein
MRNKSETQANLSNMFESAKFVGNQTKIKSLKTETGVKDTFLDHFLDGMASSYSKIKTRTAKQVELDKHIVGLPDLSVVMSPVWRIQGQDEFSLPSIFFEQFNIIIRA